MRLFRNETQEWHQVYAAGEEIICTAEHPFYLDGKGFVPARELKERDNLLSDGSKVEIESLKTEHVEIPETTYNFEVKDFHTYYVSHSKVLVHNRCNVQELHMTRREAIKYGKEFLGDGFMQIEKGLYKSKDGLRVMHFDFTHHTFNGVKSAVHINLYTFKPTLLTGRYKMIGNIHIFFL